MYESAFPVIAKYLGSFHFAEGSVDIHETKELDEFISRYNLYLKREDGTDEHRVKVLYYSDPNQVPDTLTQARAKAVTDYLISAGVEVDRMDEPFPFKLSRHLKERGLEWCQCDIEFMCYYTK